MELRLLVASVVALALGVMGADPQCDNLPALSLTDAELAAIVDELTAAAAPWTLDSTELQLAAQGESGKFCKSVNWNSPKILNHPTSRYFRYLIHAFDPQEGKDGGTKHTETESWREKTIRRTFWNYLCESPNKAQRSEVMEVLQAKLAAKGVWTDQKQFCSSVKWMWDTYFSRSRGAAMDSDGFEHVFIGDVRKNNDGTYKVGGLHYWQTLCQLEAEGRVKNVARTKPDSCVLTLTFDWDIKGDGAIVAKKPTGSLLAGEPPELLMGIGTLCMLARRGQDCKFRYKGCDVKVKAYPYGEYPDYKRCFVSSAFPMLG